MRLLGKNNILKWYGIIRKKWVILVIRFAEVYKFFPIHFIHLLKIHVINFEG